MHNIRREKIRPPPKEKTCEWCKESIHLEAFRCKYCQSYVKDIPGVGDAGVGMFVTVKKKQQTHTPSPSQTLLSEHAVANDVALAEKASTVNHDSITPRCTASPTSTIGPNNGKAIAAELSKMGGV